LKENNRYEKSSKKNPGYDSGSGVDVIIAIFGGKMSFFSKKALRSIALQKTAEV
jgi:hypothetical protein